MRGIHRGKYSRKVIDFAPFVLGVMLGTLITAFSAIGSHGRGYDSARRGAWRIELVARKRAAKAARASGVASSPATQPGLRKVS